MTRTGGMNDEQLARLTRRYRPGEKVRAVCAIVYGTGEEVAEGTVGWVQETNVGGCAPLVTVAWDGRGREGQPPSITQPCSIENLDPVEVS